MTLKCDIVKWKAPNVSSEAFRTIPTKVRVLQWRKRRWNDVRGNVISIKPGSGSRIAIKAALIYAICRTDPGKRTRRLFQAHFPRQLHCELPPGTIVAVLWTLSVLWRMALLRACIRVEPGNEFGHCCVTLMLMGRSHATTNYYLVMRHANSVELNSSARPAMNSQKLAGTRAGDTLSRDSLQPGIYWRHWKYYRARWGTQDRARDRGQDFPRKITAHSCLTIAQRSCAVNHRNYTDTNGRVQRIDALITTQCVIGIIN